jgi:hypothetical protein
MKHEKRSKTFGSVKQDLLDLLKTKEKKLCKLVRSGHLIKILIYG